MSEQRRYLQTLIRSGISGVELERLHPTSPVGKYMASIKYNGQYLSGYDCCVLCKQLLKIGRNCARSTWKHKTHHIAEGDNYSDKDLEVIIENFNNQTARRNNAH